MEIASGAGVMFCLWRFTAVNGYLYTASGIGACVLVGFAASLLTAPPAGDLAGLTIYTLHSTPTKTASTTS